MNRTNIRSDIRFKCYNCGYGADERLLSSIFRNHTKNEFRGGVVRYLFTGEIERHCIRCGVEVDGYGADPSKPLIEPENRKSNKIASCIGVIIFLVSGTFMLHYGVTSYFGEEFTSQYRGVVSSVSGKSAEIAGLVFSGIGLVFLGAAIYVWRNRNK